MRVSPPATRRVRLNLDRVTCLLTDCYLAYMLHATYCLRDVKRLRDCPCLAFSLTTSQSAEANPVRQEPDRVLILLKVEGLHRTRIPRGM